MNDDLLKWLLISDPWIEYGTRSELLGQSESDPLVADARKRMVQSPALSGIIGELKNWPGQKSHPSKYLTFLVYRILKRMGR